jgi:hypothetical protein
MPKNSPNAVSHTCDGPEELPACEGPTAREVPSSACEIRSSACEGSPACIITNLCLLGLESALVGLHGSSSGNSGKALLPIDVKAMVSGSVDIFDALIACAFVFTVVVTLRTRGRRIAIDAAMIPVPGSAVAHIVALMVIARFLLAGARYREVEKAYGSIQ